MDTTSALSLEQLTSLSTFNVSQHESAGATCIPYDDFVQKWFVFDELKLARVVITWALFAFGIVANSFLLWTMSGRSPRQTILFSLVVSDLVYALLVMPLDAMWQSTMQWFAGDAACRSLQMLKQFGMYCNSFMVAAISADRVFGISCHHPQPLQRKREKTLVALAWLLSLLCCVPAGYIFSVDVVPTCEGIDIYQCVDFRVVLDLNARSTYYFFTMMMSFVMPLAITLVSYSMISCEISNMKQRDRTLMGRRNSQSSPLLSRAKRRAVLMRTLITLVFLVCWGPYYGKGICDWFRSAAAHEPHKPHGMAMYILMYLTPVLHPIVFGICMKRTRKNLMKKLTMIKRSCGFAKPSLSRESSRPQLNSNTKSNSALSPSLRVSFSYPGAGGGATTHIVLAAIKTADRHDFSAVTSRPTIGNSDSSEVSTSGPGTTSTTTACNKSWGRATTTT